MAAKTLKVRLVRSVIGCTEKQRAMIRGLGLRKMNSESVVPDTPSTRGMIFHMQHLLEVSRGK